MKKEERNQVRNIDGDAANAGYRSRVQFPDMVRVIDPAPAIRDVPAERRENERHTEGRDGEYDQHRHMNGRNHVTIQSL